jgi:hypothetical protein
MAASCEPIEVGERARWDAALEGIPHGFWHSHAACAALQDGMRGPLRLVHVREGETRAAAPIAERSWQGSVDVYTPSGFAGFAVAGDAAKVGEAWRAFAAAQGYVAGYFALHPLFGNVDAHRRQDLAETNELFVIDLREGAAAALARADRSVRRALRSSSGVQVADFAREELAAFIEGHYAEFMRAAGANPAATWAPATLRALCADPAVHLLGARDDQGLCAAYAFATTPHGAECLVNVSIRDGREATTALIAAGLSVLAEAGLPFLHLGGGVARGDAIAAAKLKFRPERLPLLVAREVYDAERYRQLCAQAGDADAARTGYFPAYRAGAPAAESLSP